MVHTGKPSRGCERCRKRRIKCDEAAGGCSYCVKKNLPCPGYKDHFDLAWRDQTTVAEKSVLRRTHATEKTRQEFLSIYQPESSVPQPMREYPLDHALCFFFTGYIFITREPEASRGYLEHLTPVYSKVKLQSPLKYATSAVATCLFESWLSKGTGTFSSTSFYLNAISVMRQKLYQQESYSVEELLLAVMLLDLYEGLLSVAHAGTQTGMHALGAVALIKHRKVDAFQSEVSQKLLLAVRSRLIDNALKTSQPLPEDVINWIAIVSELPQTAAMRLDSINIDVAKLQALAAKALSVLQLTDAKSIAQINSIIAFAQKTDYRLAAWADSLPPSWNRLRISFPEAIPQSIQEAGVYQSQCDIYNNLFTAFTWNTYRCSRLRVQSIIQSCLILLAGTNASLQSSAIAHRNLTIDGTKALIQCLADDICYSVPLHLGDRSKPTRLENQNVLYPKSDALTYPDDHYRAAGAMGGWYILGCLYNIVAPSLPLRQGQHDWIRGQIWRVMKIYHINRSS